MSLDMFGFIDDKFESIEATRVARTVQYINGRPVSSITSTSDHIVNIQPVSDKQIQSLSAGGERINDARRIYVNDGDLYSILPSDEWTFGGIDAERLGVAGTFRCLQLDNRPWRNYCKAIVIRKDD